MTFKKTLCIAAALASVSTVASAADWSDTSISYRYGSKFSEPGIDKDVSKDIIGLTHVDGFKYGSNFFNVDVLISDHNDPQADGTSGAQEIYLVYANQLHFTKVTGKKLDLGVVKDFAWSTGFDLSSKNTAFAPKVRKFITGPVVKFGFPFGWADLGLMYYKEKNHNGIVGVNVDFQSTYRIAAAWGFNFQAGPVPLELNGFFNYTGEKGKDGFGVDTKPETWTDIFLMVDVGQIAGLGKHTLLVGPGYEYVKNKFGSSPPTAGTKTSTAMIKGEWHF
ncbi:MAG: hypothetical protein QM803_01270 [Rhodocyclaceae bacterium]